MKYFICVLETHKKKNQLVKDALDEMSFHKKKFKKCKNNLIGVGHFKHSRLDLRVNAAFRFAY